MQEPLSISQGNLGVGVGSLRLRDVTCHVCGKVERINVPLLVNQTCCAACADSHEKRLADAALERRFEDLAVSKLTGTSLYNITFQNADEWGDKKASEYLKCLPNLLNLRQPPSIRICLEGPPGTGKTHFARCLLRHVAERANMCIAEITALEYVRMAQNFRDGEYKTLLFSASRAMLLDDIDKISPTESSMYALWTLLNNRYDTPGLTIFTTNQHFTTYREMLVETGARSSLVDSIWDRMATDNVITLTGNSRRK